MMFDVDVDDEFYGGVLPSVMKKNTLQTADSILKQLELKRESFFLDREALVKRKENLEAQRIVGIIFVALSILILAIVWERAAMQAGAFAGVPEFFLCFFLAGAVLFFFRSYMVAEISYRIFMERSPFIRYTMRNGLKTYRNMYNYYTDRIIELDKKIKPIKVITEKLGAGEQLSEKEEAMLEDRETYTVRSVPCPYHDEKIFFSSLIKYLRG